MARLPYLDVTDLAAEHQDLLRRDIALNRQLAHSPGALRAFQGLGGYIRFKSPLDARLRELAILQVGYLARSPYEWSHHVKIGQAFGVTDADIDGLIADTDGRPSALDTLTRQVLQASREITNDGAVSQPTFDQLSEQMPREQMVDLIVAVSFYNAVVRILASLQIDVEPEYQPYLDRFPLPAGPQARR